jgi:plastocyanin
MTEASRSSFDDQVPMRSDLRRRFRLASIIVAGLIVGCRSDALEAPLNPDGASAYWALALDHQAITLSTAASFETIQLTATPRTVTGDPIGGLGAVTFTSSNAEVVQVDANGLVTALAPTFGVIVIAKLKANGITHADTATVVVTEGSPPTLASFSIHPVAPDSAKFALNGSLTEQFRSLIPTALDASDAPIFGLPVRFKSLDPTVATIDPSGGTITGVRTGAVTFIATTTAYGVTLADTLPFEIGLPLKVQVVIRDSLLVSVPSPNRFAPRTVTIGTGGVIEWLNATRTPVDVTFDDPTNVAAAPEWENCLYYGAPCDSGNIAPFAWTNLDDFLDQVMNERRVRRFAVPGTYHYISTNFGMDGTILVVDESP